MKTFIRLRDLLWPVLDPPSEEAVKIEEQRDKEYGDIASVLKKIEYIQDESYAEEFAKTAKSLFETEEARLKIAEGKAVTLLSATGLIITLIVNFTDKILAAFHTSTDKFIGWVILIGFMFTIIYFFRSIIYSLQGLERKAYHKLDVKDVIDSQLKDRCAYFKKTASLLLINRIKNYKVINEKVDYAVMSHLFFTRGICVLVITSIFYVVSNVMPDFFRINLNSTIYIVLFVFVVALLLIDLTICCRKKRQSPA